MTSPHPTPTIGPTGRCAGARGGWSAWRLLAGCLLLAPWTLAGAETGPPLRVVLEREQTARLLAVALYAGRYVVNENQDRINRPTADAGSFTPDLFEAQFVEMFQVRSGLDLRTIDSSRLPSDAKRLLRTMMEVSREVVAEAEPALAVEGAGFKGFVPAVFGARVAGKFAARTGIRLKQTALAPRNPSNAPDEFERAALREFADPAYPQEQVISELTAGSRSLRLMFPLYATRRCLDCHGEPKGVPDQTGYPREGLRLGQNAGAVSVVMPIEP